MKKYCLALDLVDDKKMIEAYEDHHKAVWPEIIESILSSGIVNMEIHRFSNRLFMIMYTEDNFSFDKKSKMDAVNEYVKKWEALMWGFQKAIPGAGQGEKWVVMQPVFKLKD